MKKMTCLFVFIILFIPYIQGQTFSLALQPGKQAFTVYSQSNFPGYQGGRRMCIATKTGGIIASAGFVTTLVGLVVIIGNTHLLASGYSNDANINSGVRIAQAGGVLALLGGVIGLVGAIHDHTEYKRWSIIAPQRNKIGLAYNFN